MVRYKKRYILVEVENARKKGSYIELKGKDPEFAVLNAIVTMYGEYGTAVVQPLKIHFISSKCGLMMIQVPYAEYRKVLSVIPIITNFAGLPVVAKTLTVAGSPQVAYKFLKKYNEQILEEFLANNKEFVASKRRRKALCGDVSDSD